MSSVVLHQPSVWLTYEEQELIDSIENGEWIESSPEELEYINQIHSERLKLWFRSISETNQAILSEMKAGYSAPRMKRTSINLYSEDITRAQEIAKELGVEYQVFLRDFLHRHLEAAFEVYKNI